jgi:hypothetical protein
LRRRPPALSFVWITRVSPLLWMFFFLGLTELCVRFCL